MADDNDPASRHWHLDKRIPVAIIITLAIQTGGAIWFASGISHRVDSLERQQISSASQGDRIIRLETRMESIAEHLIEIRNLLRQREQRP
jgi:hypothetical protein